MNKHDKILGVIDKQILKISFADEQSIDDLKKLELLLKIQLLLTSSDEPDDDIDIDDEKLIELLRKK